MIFRRSPDLEAEEIEDGEVLGQRVCRGPDSVPEVNAPRPKDRGSVSLIRGQVSPTDAYHLVRKGGQPDGDDGVRYTTAGELREAGFVVEHTPNPRNPGHVSIRYPGDWGQDVALLFKVCFGETLWKGDEDE